MVPYIDVFLEDGRMKDEWKMGAESRRILGLPDLPVAATCVRVPEFVGHAEAVSVELERPLGVEDAPPVGRRPGRARPLHRAGGYAGTVAVT